MSEEKRAHAEVVELAAIVALNSLDGGTELCAHISKEIRQGGKGVRFQTQWERP